MTNPPTILANSSMSVQEGCSSIANSSGNLLFYTDGITVWNQSHVVMANGTGLLGDLTTSQSSIILKKPGNLNQYYIFTVQGGGGTAGLNYSIVDMSLSAGMGSVTVKNSPLFSSPCSEKLTATRHCNGTDYWIVCHEYLNNSFRSFQLSASGVNLVSIISSIGTNHTFFNSTGCMKISPHGKKLGVAMQGGPFTASFEIFDFDINTGVVSNSLTLGNNFFSAYGCEFSNDGSMFYGCSSGGGGARLYQWNLCAGSPIAIAASQYTASTLPFSPGSMQLAPNGKIYLSENTAQSIGVINNPNLIGSACNYVAGGQSVSPNLTYAGLPNFMGSLFLYHPTPPAFTSTVSNNFGCQAVAFMAASVQSLVTSCSAPVYSVTGLSWNFGDPASGLLNVSTNTNPVHAFTNVGSYTVQLIYYYSCGGGTDTLRQVININQPCISVISNSITCASLGSATVTPNGGTGPFSYTWMPGSQNSSVATGLSPGTYTISIFDAGSNLTYTSTTSFTSLIPLNGTFNNSSGITCNGASTGTAIVTNISGGSANQNYLWTNGSQTYTSPNPNNLSAGSWTAIVTDALTGCTINNMFVITQPPALTLNIVANTPTACAGSNIVLTGSNSGGTPIPIGSGYTFTWTNGPSSDTHTISELNSGVYIYSVSSSDANNCLSGKTFTVSFIQNPILSVSNVSICPLQTGVLTANGATSYIWNNFAAGNTLSDTPATSTQYSVTGSALGCTTIATASIILKPLPVPIINTNGPRCNGDNLLLNGSGGTSYLWSGPVLFSSSIQNPTINVVGLVNAGVYNLTVTAANGCTASVSSAVVINQTPTLSVLGSTVCSSQSMSLTANSVAGASYNWTGPQTFSSNAQNVVVNQPALNMLGNYTVNVTSVQGCTNMAVTNASIIAPPTTSIALSSTSMCAQALSGSPNSIVLNSSGANTYTLSVPNHIYNPNPAGPASPLSLVPPYLPTGPATATLYGSNGVCTVSTTAVFSVIPNPTVSIVSPTPVICAGQTVTYTSAGANSYNWSAATPGSFVYTTGNVAVTNPSISSVFSVFGGSLGCNSALQSHNITVNPLPVLNVSNAMVCSGSSALLTTTGTGTSFTWSPGLYLNNANSSSVIVTPLAPQNYTVLASLTNCTTSAVLTVSTLPLPVASISADKTTFCQNDKIIMEGMGGSSYSWEGPSGYKSFGKVIEVSAFSTAYSGIYTLTIQDENNCKGIATQVITVHRLPQGDFAGSLQQGCAPLCTDFNFKPSSGSSPILSANWQVGNQPMGSNNFKYCFNSPGTYVVSGALTDIHNCSNTVSTSVNVHPKPVADFYFTPNEPLENWEEVQLIDASQNAVRHSWKIGNVNFSSTSPNPSYLFENAGTYPVALVVNNQWQCSDTVVKNIHVSPDVAIYVPNAFTPNADDLNETLIPVIRGNYQFTFSVFNRWGQKVFETSDITKGWDGTFKGQPCQQDTYAWKLNVSFETKMMTTNGKQEKNLAGSVLLYR